MDKILIVDDELDMLNAAKMIFEGEGYVVVGAVSGEEAIQKAESEIPDLILLDVVLPGKMGIEVCKHLKTQIKTKHIPIIMFTALMRDVDRQMSADAGADGYFNKPFTPDTLLVEVKKHLQAARIDKFSRQIGLGLSRLQGKKILLEYQPSAPCPRLVRDFVMECLASGEKVIVLTRMGTAVRRALEGDQGIDLRDVSTSIPISKLLQEHEQGPLSLVYDSITDLVISTNIQNAYMFLQNTLSLLSDKRITALFLLNSAAHEEKDENSLRGLFSDHIVYENQGLSSVRFT